MLKINDGARQGLSPKTNARARFSWLLASLRASLPAACFLLLSATRVWAQADYSGDQYGQVAQPDMWATYGERILIFLVAGAVGFGIGAFFSPLLKPFRRFIWLGALALGVLYSLFGPSPNADILNGFVAFVVFCIALVLGLRLGQKLREHVAGKRVRPTSFGSAKWATIDYLTQHGLFSGSGFVVGEFFEGGKRTLLRYNGVRHWLCISPTRGGKGVSTVVPNLLLHEGSALVIDPKAENALITCARRGAGDVKNGIKGMGQQIFLLDPWDIASSKLGLKPSRFNPLDWIVAGDPDAAENAFLLADALVIKEGHGESAFWDEEAKALLTGFILYVATATEEIDSRNLGRVRDILTQDDDSLKATLVKMFNHPHPMVSSTAARTASKDPKLRSSVLASAQAHTHFLDSPRIRASLAASDFKFEDLKTQKITAYLVIPADRISTFNRWLRLLIQQAITVNARNISEKPDKPIMFLLDEMPALGRLPSVQQAFSLMAGFGIQIFGIVQDLSQLAHIYGETGWQTFISNSGVIQYFGSRDKMTAEYFSSLCGVTTVEIHNFSWAVGRALSYASSFTSGQGGGSSSNSNSTTDNWTRTNGTSEAQRQLAYPDELMVLHGYQQVVFVENLDPIMAEKIIWYTDPALRALGVDLQGKVPETPRLTVAA